MFENSISAKIRQVYSSRHKCHVHGQRGFSLLESVIAMGIVVAVGFFLVNSYQKSMAVQSAAKARQSILEIEDLFRGHLGWNFATALKGQADVPFDCDDLKLSMQSFLDTYDIEFGNEEYDIILGQVSVDRNATALDYYLWRGEYQVPQPNQSDPAYQAALSCMESTNPRYFCLLVQANELDRSFAILNKPNLSHPDVFVTVEYELLDAITGSPLTCQGFQDATRDAASALPWVRFRYNFFWKPQGQTNHRWMHHPGVLAVTPLNMG